METTRLADRESRPVVGSSTCARQSRAGRARARDAGASDEDDLDAAPVERRRRRLDRDPPRALVGQEVRRRRPGVDAPRAPHRARREEQLLAQRRLPGVDVGHDPDHARVLTAERRRAAPRQVGAQAPPRTADTQWDH